VDAVASGFGVSWLLCPLGDALPELVRLRDPPLELDTQIWVLTHPDLKRVARVKALTDFLFERLSSDPRLVVMGNCLSNSIIFFGTHG
jgi:DNA-binding transcriptional LysR family regulator